MQNTGVSKTRKIYFLRLAGRILVFILAIIIYICDREQFVVAIGSFYSWSLVAFAFVIWLVWEICVLVYPERFWENSNMALRCSECTDKLCTQYCRKLRNK